MWPEQRQQHHCYWFCWCKTQCLQCCKTTPWHEWIGSRDRKAASSPRSQRCRSWKEICCPRRGSLWKAALWLDPLWLDAVIRYLIEQLLSAAVADVVFFSHNFCCCERIVERQAFVVFPWETEYLHSRRRHDVIEHPTSSYLRIDWWSHTMHAILRPKSYPSSKGLTSFFIFFTLLF